MSSSQAEFVRNAFRHVVTLHSGLEPTTSILETTLIRDGSYCGRRFSMHGYNLIWFIDEQQIKLFDRSGSLLKSMATRDFCMLPSTAFTNEETRRAA
jgi:hypothetical protein